MRDKEKTFGAILEKFYKAKVWKPKTSGDTKVLSTKAATQEAKQEVAKHLNIDEKLD